MKPQTNELLRVLAGAKVLFPQGKRVGENTPLVFASGKGDVEAQGIAQMKMVADDLLPGTPTVRRVTFEAGAAPSVLRWVVEVEAALDDTFVPSWQGKLVDQIAVETEVTRVR